MLTGILYFEPEMPAYVIKGIEKSFADVGWRLDTYFAKDPPTFEELFSYNPDVLIVSGTINGNLWPFLLRLKQFRIQGKRWPKIICPLLTIDGGYDPKSDDYNPNKLDYYSLLPPYRRLYDISLEYPIHSLEVCLPLIELEYLVQKRKIKKQWILANGQADFGTLTFNHLNYDIDLSWPIMVCDFQPGAKFSELKNYFLEEIFKKEKSLHPNAWPISYPDSLNLHLKSTSKLNYVDRFLANKDDFIIYIDKTEARVYIEGIGIDYSKQL